MREFVNTCIALSDPEYVAMQKHVKFQSDEELVQ